ncbi:LANO_0F14708g1_1 [Lachancea nothofagi CBS 11611]|uniref:LANO_0F14708g1_1 n=1 Tax=Lachancea nothofagi CBS 11611 TaxID=1266666 RepID=A0A1G4KCA4_9SACH|nr:LANO_0F14708g1_1 [Lachancea nothofagi CBS 11611]
MKAVTFASAGLAIVAGAHAYNSKLDQQSNVTAMNLTGTHGPERPLAHLTPTTGWMNDPNGLFYDNETATYHAYYQYNPNDNVWDLPLFWGHASSKNLVTWEDHGVALEPMDDESGAFSGSIVIDRNNTSGFFDNSTLPGQRIVALYTENSNVSESQFAAYSLDGGYTFDYYEHNPVLDINSTQFRDPKVFWHDETERWIMTLALSQEYKIQIYTSENLTSWEFKSNFSHHGILGYQYECPGLAKVPVIHDSPSNVTLHGNNSTMNATAQTNSSSVDHKWVMFISINPGAPMGGSFNEYFIGDFDGETFTAQDAATRVVDHGKDFYAMQTFSDAPNNDVLGIAWASNWDYAAYVPTEDYRSSMSLVRNLTLRPYSPNPETTEFTLYSEPILNYTQLNTNQSMHKTSLELNSEESVSYRLGKSPQGLLEFSLEWKVNSSALTSKHEFADMSLYFQGAEDDDEYLRLGYEQNAAAFFLDRGNSEVDFVNENPFFNNRVSQNIEIYKIAEDGLPIFKVRGIIDRNIIELFFNDGSSTSTNLFFLSEENYIGTVEISSGVDNVYTILDFDVKQLSVKNE